MPSCSQYWTRETTAWGSARRRERRVIHAGAIFTAITGMVALSSCSDLTGIDAPGTREFRGRYTSGFEASAFVPCEKPEGAVGWWTEFELTQQSASLDSALRANRDPQNPFRATELYLEVRARLTKRGAFGHLNSWQRQLTVITVRRVAVWSNDACR